MTKQQYDHVAAAFDRKILAATPYQRKELSTSYRAGVSVAYRALETVHNESQRRGIALAGWTDREYQEMQDFVTKIFQNKQHPIYQYKNAENRRALRAGMLAGKSILHGMRLALSREENYKEETDQWTKS